MKLMAKTAEERYQSAYGIKADLETCLTQSKNQDTQTFILGSQDICHYLQISQKLYGREDQIQTLLNTLTRVVSPQAKQNSPELILISGYSGIGKSALVRELYQLITEKRGYFISGKFDQLYRDIPYQALISAFKDLMRQLLTESETQLQEWRHKILAGLGVNAQIIIDIIPELELIIGQPIAVTELSLTEAQNRFNLVFRQFIQIFCQPEHPLVLFLDDLQWLDSATLKLLQVLITHISHLLIFTCQDKFTLLYVISRSIFRLSDWSKLSTVNNLTCRPHQCMHGDPILMK
jgi:predicted ATPase